MNIFIYSADNVTVRSQETSYAIKALNPGEDDEILRISSIKELESGLAAPSLFAERQIFVLTTLLPSADEKALIALLPELTDQQMLIVMTNKISASLKSAVGKQGVAQTLTGKNYRESATLLLDRHAPELSGSVKAFLTSHVGKDYIMLYTIIADCKEVFSSLYEVTVSNIEPYLPEQGAIDPWEITDAIDVADAGRALRGLERVLKVSKPYDVYIIVNNHFDKMLKLSLMNFTDEKEAAEFLGMKGSTYPALKAMRNMRRYKSVLPELYELITQMGADLIGESGLPKKTILQVGIGRLCMYPRR